MTLLEIVITPLPEKHMELIQTLNSLLGELQQYSSNFSIKKTGNVVNLKLELENQEQLKKFTNGNDCNLFWGAINTLGTNSEVFINGIKNGGLDLSGKLNFYHKREKRLSQNKSLKIKK